MKNIDQHGERQKSINEMDDIIKADFEWKADKMRQSSFDTTSEEIETAIRSGNCESALNTALVAAWYYPEMLKIIGYGCEIARQATKCRLAYSVLDQIYRRSFVILARVANERGLDVAAVEAGQIALKDAYKPALHGDGTKYGLELKDNKPWTELVTGNEWDKLPVVTREELRNLKKVLSELNHGSNPERPHIGNDLDHSFNTLSPAKKKKLGDLALLLNIIKETAGEKETSIAIMQCLQAIDERKQTHEKVTTNRKGLKDLLHLNEGELKKVESLLNSQIGKYSERTGNFITSECKLRIDDLFKKGNGLEIKTLVSKIKANIFLNI